jgi:TP901 family phage tail tape measure protein
MAKNVGLTTTEVANLSIAFFRQGRSAVDALRLTETAAKFAKIAAIDVNDAANFLTAAINGFNLAASDATRIIDKFAALGAGAAASAQEIAIALSKVAPAAASAGVEIDNLMAFVTKGIETTREAPENIGTAFKTIFARMRELTDIGKTIEDGMDVNRVEASLRSIGVALRDGNGEFRNLDEVLLEVGQRWDSIDRNQQAYLATTLAGTRQQTRLIALFEDFDRTLELIELSQDSAGVAALQHAEYMNGLEAANTRLRTSFQQLITSFVNSEMVIGFINLLNDVLELANTGMGKLVVTAGLLTLGITALSKVQAVNTLVTTMMAAAKLRYNEALISGTLASGAAAKGTNLLSIAKVKLIAVTKALSAAIMAIPLVGWILAAIAALVALAVAFQRVRNSTDTTNIKIARLKVVFDRFIEAVKGFGEAIVGVFENLVSLFNNPAFKTGLRILLAVVTLGVSEVAKASYDLVTQLDEVGEAAASFRVLANQLRESNAQVFTLTKTSNQLNKEIKEFIRLDNIAFKTPAELRQRTEAQNVLKDSMRSTLDTMLEIGDIDRETFSREIAILDSSNTAEAITQQANRILKMQTDELARIQKEQQTAVVNYMNTFEGSFAEAAKSADFADLVEFLPSFAQEVAAAEAELAGLEFSSVQRDAINRAIALDPTAYLDGLNTAKEATNEFYLKTIPELESTLQSALSSSGDDFVKVVQSLQNIDLSLLSENQKALIANLLPNFAIFKNLSEQQLAGVAKAGGAAYLREFQNISKDIGRINFLPTPTTNPTLIANAEKSAQEISEYFFDAFAVSAEEKASVAEALLQEIYSGVVNGVRLNPEQQASLANVVINALGAVDMAGIQRNVLNFMEDLGKIEEILTKPLDRMTAADLAVLQQYPGVLDQVLAGTFDINEFRQQGIAALEKDIDLAEEQLRLALANKQTLRETGQITEQEFEESANILNTNLNLLTVKRQMLRAERINVDAIRQRYKMELDLLNAQRKAIEDAKKMRDLQKDSADIARRSIDATRTGALSTIEAQFNRQQLNAEIADANKALQDNIMMAQLEAQQKILEDSQQKAIEAATEANTIATRENTTAVQSFVSSATRIAGAMTSAASAIVSGLTGNNTVISPIIPNATSTTAPRSTTNSGSQSGAFNDIVGFAEGPT